MEEEARLAGADAEKEVVDFSSEDDGYVTYSDGELSRLDQHNEIDVKWMKERVIVWVSALTIILVLIAALLTVGFGADENNLDWARQSLTVLLGFAAGAIWNSKGGNNK